mmetsp:Transcript_30158/g.70162  ORF Transcript_30158/g.70162 Transcript_30158/m.70162 type:complete len:227 (+) Transcript_30158:164-844(+)
MGERWLGDFEKAKKTALELARKLQSQGESQPDPRQAAVLRVSMAQLRQEVSHLEQSLMTTSQNAQAHGVTRKELSRRGDLLAGLSEQVENIQEAVRSGMRRRVDSAEAPWRDGRASDFSNGSRGERVPEGDLMLMADREMGNQDETLDFLLGTVHNLKNMGGDISQEIDLHCQLLGEAESQTESLLGKNRQQQTRLSVLKEEPVTCYLWVCICVLLVTLFVLLVFF